ncbi:MAG TPA: hypothetical protein VHL79_19715 [Ramlibacter sp.]|jgi:hypothetical protein|nr:hypothetical protein [Ramlibacter sp.]
MDYRHTEDFARSVERAALRAHAMRDEAIDAYWKAAGAFLRRTWRWFVTPVNSTDRHPREGGGPGLPNETAARGPLS